ncbi:MAG: MmcQ/YjbR family DNA-binding protein [Blastocatellia bacterium]
MKTDHLARVRAYCLSLPEVTEKLSHGAPTFFVRKKVFAMYVNNHHNDGRIAVWCAAPAGVQEMLLAAAPVRFFKPPYVGVRGWIGIHLDQHDDAELASHLRQAWLMIAPVKLHAALPEAGR